MRLGSAVVISAAIAGLTTPGCCQAIAVRVHAETTFQTITGFGSGLSTTLRWMNAIQNPRDRDRAYDLLYGAEGVRLNIVRLNISPAAQPLAAKTQGIRYDWEHDAETQATWQAIQPVLQRTNSILYAVPFTAPPQWKTNHARTRGGKLIRSHYRDYAEYLADFVAYQHTVIGVDLDVLSLQNEPGVAAPWDSTVWTGEEMRDFLKILAPMVRARGPGTKIMATEGTAWSGAWQRLGPILSDPATRGLLQIIASHSYGPADDPARSRFAAASKQYGLPVWMSEMSLMDPPQPDDPGMNAALRVARYLHRDLVDGHASAWIYCFAIFNPAFPGSMGVLSPPGKQGALVVPKRLWAMANYSRFVQPGWKLMQVDSPGFANTGFVSPEGDRFVIVALNDGASPKSAAYDFGGRTLGKIDAYRTGPILNLGPLPAPARQAHQFNAELPAGTITTFVGELAGF